VLAAVVVGLWAMVFLSGLMRGIVRQMVRNGVATLTGHIQIHHQGYRNDPVIGNSIRQVDWLKRALTDVLPASARWSFRIRVNAVANNARHSGGVTLVGIDPESEARVSFIGSAVTDGRYLDSGDVHGILIGEALRKKFETEKGHKLVLMSPDTSGEIASRAFRIVGVFRAEMAATEKRFVFVLRKSAGDMLKLGDRISEAAILLSDFKQAGVTAAAVKSALASDTLVVHTWRELLPMVDAMLKMYDWFIFLWFFVIFIAMGFGIVNTLLMAVYERIREFGLLKALGMNPGRIVAQVLCESGYLLALGMIAGNTLGIATIALFSRTGIDLTAMAEGLEFVHMSRIIYPVFTPADLVTANGVVAGLGLLVSLYPALKAGRITPVAAMARQ
jgi:ABC-type lipoprotein release transport system permease subunit